jgi:hypothetical protein
MSDPAITIDLIALTDWETGAPETDPNRDNALDADEALGNICPGCNGTGLEILYHSAAVSWETGEPLDSEEIHCRTCGGGGYLTEPAFDADEATDARHEYLIIDRSTEQIIVPIGAHATACTAINVPVETPFDADEAPPVTVVNLTNCPETGYTDNASLPPPRDMSIFQLDGWDAYHAARQLLGRALSDAERAHWDEVRGQINSRHEARRHSYFSR